MPDVSIIAPVTMPIRAMAGLERRVIAAAEFATMPAPRVTRRQLIAANAERLFRCGRRDSRAMGDATSGKFVSLNTRCWRLRSMSCSSAAASAAGCGSRERLVAALIRGRGQEDRPIFDDDCRLAIPPRPEAPA